ncbi:recombination-associated protein RdgC [Zymobacter palmae]|uniref:Recombination-associated protein RdgC n=1 Tax=Zymobacter palmae TaxID=33074 RepID=A0A348HFN4_9GAMM|nr:recombination-associated protein RdgC [Zymobacter palmae]BBG30436.1 DNA recombination-dependent growth factor C [Zymobacter palmae]
MSWFRNIYLYRVHDAQPIPLGVLLSALAEHRFQTVGPHEARRYGWTAPAGRNSDVLAHEVGGQRLIRLAEQQRMLPSSVIKEELEERCAEQEAKQGFPPRRRERQALKESLIEELLPQAFARTTVTDLWWDTKNQLIGINCASAKRAETVLDALRQSLGALKVTPLAVREPISRVMTAWVRDAGARPNGLVVGDMAELRGNDDGVIRARKMDVDGEEIQAAISAGRTVSKLSIQIEGVLGMTLHEDMTLKSLAFDDALLDEANDVEDEGDPIMRTETDLVLMAGALTSAVQQLVGWLGGEQDAAAASAFSLTMQEDG